MHEWISDSDQTPHIVVDASLQGVDVPRQYGDALFVPLKFAVLTVSDTRTLVTDTSGKLAADLLAEAGHTIVTREIVTDNRDKISECLQRFIADETIEVVITTGGTGVTPRDVTPEALAPHVTKAIPGFGELFRMLSYHEIGPAACTFAFSGSSLMTTVSEATHSTASAGLPAANTDTASQSPQPP